MPEERFALPPGDGLVGPVFGLFSLVGFNFPPFWLLEGRLSLLTLDDGYMLQCEPTVYCSTCLLYTAVNTYRSIESKNT